MTYSLLGLSLLFASLAYAATPCDQLTLMTIPNVTIDSASPDTIDTHSICRVRATASSVPDSEIHFEVWLPNRTEWNGKFLGTGNGGYMGVIGYPAMTAALNQGYATAGSDTGHVGGHMRFGLGHPEKVVDFAYRAGDEMTVAAKLIVHEYMGKFAAESYFSSCSTGGHQALSEVERYPEL